MNSLKSNQEKPQEQELSKQQPANQSAKSFTHHSKISSKK